MAWFAELDDDNLVRRVLVVPDAQAGRAEAFLAGDLGLGGRWLETRADGSLRRRLAAPGMVYDAARDAFIAPRPYPSWTLGPEDDWHPPVPRPETGDWVWDEAAQGWVAGDGPA